MALPAEIGWRLLPKSAEPDAGPEIGEFSLPVVLDRPCIVPTWLVPKAGYAAAAPKSESSTRIPVRTIVLSCMRALHLRTVWLP